MAHGATWVSLVSEFLRHGNHDATCSNGADGKSQKEGSVN